MTCKRLLTFGILGGLIAANALYGQEPPTYVKGAGGERESTKNEFFSGESAARTRDSLKRLMEGVPPSLFQILQLDPTLLGNPEYLKPYPQLWQFLQEHPEVMHNPNYFLGSPDYPYNVYRYESRNGVSDLLEGMFFIVIFIGVGGTLFWMLRTFVDHRRWLRLSKLQTEANAKLMDRFTSNEDLLNFIQTPAGNRFLESSTVPGEPRAIGAPVGRILWSTQIGLVLFAVGLGFELLSARIDTVAAGLDPRDGRIEVMFGIFGVLALAAGIGFIVSGVVSYLLSQRLGLMENLRMTSPPGGTIQKPS
jgi:hypothetical protein